MNRIDLQGKTCVITGGAQGIGYAIGKRVLLSGGKLAIWDISSQKGEDAVSALATYGECKSLCVDVVSAESVESATRETIDHFGAIDCLVNSAGVTGPVKPVSDYSMDEWCRVIEVNLTGTFNTCRVIVPHMELQDYGRIVNIASVAGKEGNPNLAAYSAAKAGVIGLTKSLGKEVAKTGVAVNCITPGTAQTKILDQLTPEFVEYMRVRIPRERFAKVNEISAMVAWLLSAENSFTTAATFDLSGGRTTY